MALAAVWMAAVMLTACGRGQKPDREGTDAVDRIDQPGQSIEDLEDGMKEAAVQENPSETEAESAESDEKEQDHIRKRFGDHCIAEQTFEVELSEYPGKVWVVPFLPAQAGEGLEIKIMQDGEVLKELDTYLPAAASGQDFSSLDAVSFYDMNYDGCTDIVLIETYGDVSFAVVYNGYGGSGSDDPVFFVLRERLSESLSEQVMPLTVQEIRNFISGGKRNGEFGGYQEAYEAVARLSDMTEDDYTYDLYYVDEDDIPELAVCRRGYSVSLYTYQDGTIYNLMDHWGYGAMGNAGYEYAPHKNNITNYNNDYAGAILYTTYMEISAQHTIEVTARIETFNFDDANQNGYPDEEEMESMGLYGASYIDGVEISPEEAASYNVGGYELMEGSMSLQELLENL